MITSHALPRLGMGAVLLTTALLLFAQHPVMSHAEGTADNVHEIDLAKMVLPLSAYGPDYAAFEMDLDSNVGFEPEDDRDSREVNAYFLVFSNPDLEAISGPVLVGAAAGLFGSADGAAAFVSDTRAESQRDIEDSGGTFITFPVPGIEGAIGFQANLSEPDFDFVFQFAGVIFTVDRLIGEVVFLRYDNADLQSAAISAATALNDRMKDVLTGTVTDFPKAFPPDVNCNGSLDAIDASLELQLSAALVASLPCGALGDANQDGSINAIDASLILQYSAGLIDSLPV
jgi:hypothetical protein